MSERHRSRFNGLVAVAMAVLAAALAFGPTASAADALDPIRAEIARQHDEGVRRLQEWVRQPAIAAESRGTNEGCELMMRLAREAGFDQVTRVPTDGHPAVFATLDASAPRTIGLYFMYDVNAARGGSQRPAAEVLGADEIEVNRPGRRGRGVHGHGVRAVIRLDADPESDEAVRLGGSERVVHHGGPARIDRRPAQGLAGKEKVADPAGERPDRCVGIETVGGILEAVVVVVAVAGIADPVGVEVFLARVGSRGAEIAETLDAIAVGIAGYADAVQLEDTSMSTRCTRRI